jgi:hypothetical protein
MASASSIGQMTATSPNIATLAAFSSHLLTQFLFVPWLFISPPLDFRNLAADGVEPTPQMEHLVMLAREQRVDGFGRHLLEAAPIKFVRDENVALFFGKPSRAASIPSIKTERA